MIGTTLALGVLRPLIPKQRATERGAKLIDLQSSREQPTTSVKQEVLWTKDFILLNIISFLVYCNLAIFFQFHSYLESLPIAPSYYGLLIGLFSLAPLVIRPLISPFLRPDNAGLWIVISTPAVMIALVLYGSVQMFWGMAAVRLFHGFWHTVLATSLVARLVGSVPTNRSAQAFGIVSVVILLPYAALPPALPYLNGLLGGFDRTLMLLGALMALIFPLVWMLDPVSDRDCSAPESGGALSLADNLKDRRLWSLFAVALLVWTSYTPVFYFVRDYGLKEHMPNPGWFFTVSTFAEVGVRLLAGRMLDKLRKEKVLLVALGLLELGYAALANVVGPYTFYGVGLFLGLGWGMAMPLLNGLVFDVSEPRFRALNTNLVFQMFQGGFLVGPIVGGAVLSGYGYGLMFYSCGAMILMAMCFAAPMVVGTRARES